MEDMDELIGHLAATTRLSPAEAGRVVAEVLEFFGETVDAFVVRRHAQLQGRELGNPAIFERIAAELDQRRFAAQALSERQIRRLVYG
jgi:hypothetical protein